MTTYVTVTNASEPCTPGAVVRAYPSANTSSYDVTFAPSGFVTTASAAGVFSIPLLPTDSSQVDSPGWSWTITVEPTEGVAALTYTFWLTALNGLTQDLSTLSSGNPSGQPATQSYVSAAVAEVTNANSDGYATWTNDPDVTFPVTSPATVKATWAAGVIFLNKIPVPFALSGLTGVLAYSWKAATGTGGLNAFIGVYSLASSTFTRQAVSSDVSAQTQGHPNTLSASYLQNIAADTSATALYAAVLIGTQDSVGMGPLCSAGVNSNYFGGVRLATTIGPSRLYYSNAGGQTSLPSSIPLANVTSSTGSTNAGAMTWWGIY